MPPLVSILDIPALIWARMSCGEVSDISENFRATYNNRACRVGDFLDPYQPVPVLEIAASPRATPPEGMERGGNLAPRAIPKGLLRSGPEWIARGWSRPPQSRLSVDISLSDQIN